MLESVSIKNFRSLLDLPLPFSYGGRLECQGSGGGSGLSVASPEEIFENQAGQGGGDKEMGG